MFVSGSSNTVIKNHEQLCTAKSRAIPWNSVLRSHHGGHLGNPSALEVCCGMARGSKDVMYIPIGSWDWYIYLRTFIQLIFMVNVGKYISPMDPIIRYQAIITPTYSKYPWSINVYLSLSIDFCVIFNRCHMISGAIWKSSVFGDAISGWVWPSTKEWCWYMLAINILVGQWRSSDRKAVVAIFGSGCQWPPKFFEQHTSWNQRNT